MDNLPKPKLGNVTAFTIATSDLEVSLKFYQQLGFEELYRMDFPFPWIQITDGAVLIMLRKDKDPYLALTYYVNSLEPIVSELEANGISFVQKPKTTDIVKRYVMQSPDGLNISLVSIPDYGFKQPPGATMLTMPQEDYFRPEKYVNKICGMWGELAEPVKDLDASILFWEKLGFVALSKYQSPSPWAILSDGLAIIGLHQTTEFSEPAMTFFAADMKEKLTKLKQEGLEIYRQVNAGNAVVKTPEKQTINLFSFGM